MGRLMKRNRFDRPPRKLFKQGVTPQVALTCEHHGAGYGRPKRHSAWGVCLQVKAAGIKHWRQCTGTVKKQEPLYDPKTGISKRGNRVEKAKGQPIVIWRNDMDEQHPGNRRLVLMPLRHLKRPQLAIAVLVEGGGYGSKSARAGLPAALVLKAKDLGSLQVVTSQPPKINPGSQRQPTTGGVQPMR